MWVPLCRPYVSSLQAVVRFNVPLVNPSMWVFVYYSLMHVFCLDTLDSSPMRKTIMESAKYPKAQEPSNKVGFFYSEELSWINKWHLYAWGGAVGWSGGVVVCAQRYEPSALSFIPSQRNISDISTVPGPLLTNPYWPAWWCIVKQNLWSIQYWEAFIQQWFDKGLKCVINRLYISRQYLYPLYSGAAAPGLKQ